MQRQNGEMNIQPERDHPLNRSFAISSPAAATNTHLRRSVLIPLLFVSLLFLLPYATGAEGAASATTDHATVEILPAVRSIAPGEPFMVAFKFKLIEDWHLYWTNPGDAGLAPRVRWNLPEGFSGSSLEFPAPHRIAAGPLVSFGYNDELVLLAKVAPPANLKAGDRVTIEADLDWLVCQVECVPEQAVIGAELPVATRSEIDPENHALISAARDALPAQNHAWKDNWSFLAEKTADSLIIIGGTKAGATIPDSVLFFPEEKGLIENAAPQVLTLAEDGFRLAIPRNSLFTGSLDSLSGLLVVKGDWNLDHATHAIRFMSQFDNVPTSGVATAAAGGSISFWEALLFAFIGGLILNLMPCVLPVLSIKILGFVQQAHHDRKDTFLHSLSFLIGVLISFWVLAGALLLLRAGGEHLGWGFQLQSPAFLIILAALMFLMGLNLFGVFEVGASLTGVGGGSRRSGMLGSFISGITATVVATPCTAPFMGSALGFSLTQPPLVSLAIFTMLGAGMAAPFVLVTNVPALVRFLPKPGRWMETLKQFMGFLLMATVVWLAWVLGIQGGSDLVVWLLGALLIVAIGAWILGRWGGLASGTAVRYTAKLVSTALIIGVVAFTALNADVASNSAADQALVDGKLTWEPYSSDRVAGLRSSGQPVLIDFTAAWCLSCKVNERVAFGADEVQAKLIEKNVATIKADWTNRSDEITAALAEFGRNSVPLYVLYSGEDGREPLVLPEILTPRIVLDALEKI